MANGAWQVRSSRATKFRTTKINSGGRVLFFTKICTPENYPLYGKRLVTAVKTHYAHSQNPGYSVHDGST